MAPLPAYVTVVQGVPGKPVWPALVAHLERVKQAGEILDGGAALRPGRHVLAAVVGDGSTEAERGTVIGNISILVRPLVALARY